MELGHTYNAISGLSLVNSIYFSANSNAIEMLTTVDSTGSSHTSNCNPYTFQPAPRPYAFEQQLPDLYLSTNE